ncbi:hypothetical protein NPIL_495831 [Nephila pilipes]|uniref:Uncharacterized protein n=1 Tax=Nephila pilipes TaxID=299642 RepID=A0A8X6PS70_NEPPI|nr:hypothetical protein NPIL_495831 [Nephila pilipes]
MSNKGTDVKYLPIYKLQPDKFSESLKPTLSSVFNPFKSLSAESLSVTKTVEGQKKFCSKTECSLEISGTIDTSSLVSFSDEESFCKSRGANEGS